MVEENHFMVELTRIFSSSAGRILQIAGKIYF
jgi:hypothetical protein